MSGCTLCPRRCGVDRAYEEGFCRSGVKVSVARAALHFWEEPPISGTRGSGTVFFTGCSLGCIFCQNRQISHGENRGKGLTAEELSAVFFRLYDKGAHNINLVTPTHFVPQIADALRVKKLPIPVVYNCGGYESVESLRLLRGLVDIYLPDFKYAENHLGKMLSGVPDYKEIAIAAIHEMRLQQGENVLDAEGMLCRGLIIRHLILPLHTKNSLAVLGIIKKEFPDTPVSLMAQYTPVGEEINKYPELCRKITWRELAKVEEELFRLNLDGFVQSRKSATEGFIPAFNNSGV